MTLGLLFWFLMLFWLIFGGYRFYSVAAESRTFGILGNDFLLFVLIFILGWAQFGWPIKG